MSENNQIDDTSTNKPTFSDMSPDLSSKLVKFREAIRLAKLRKLCKTDSGSIGRSFKYVESLPTDTKDIVNSMNAIKHRISNISNEAFKLRCKYTELHKFLIRKRSLILSNDVVGPTAAKVARKELQKTDYHKPKICTCGNVNLKSGLWWLSIFGTPLLSKLTKMYDFLALKHMTHACVTCSDDKSDDVKFFDIHFVFAENKYFENKELTKRYYYTETTDSDAYKIIKSSGCKINWKNGMNLTSSEEFRKLTGTNLDKSAFKSFFDIFTDHDVKSNSHLTDEEKTVLQLSQHFDFRIGLLLKSSITAISEEDEEEDEVL